MCYAIPGKVVKINIDSAVIDFGGVKKDANISMIDNINIGDFVLVHAGFAIEKVDKMSAEDSLKLIKDHIKNG